MKARAFSTAVNFNFFDTVVIAEDEYSSNRGGFLGAGTLVAVYNRVEISIKETTALATSGQTMNLSIPSPGSTDLYMVSYAIESDVAAPAGGLSMSPPNPHPGDAVNLVASVVNQGSVAHANIPVRFYNGDPAVDGVEIATVLVDGPLPPGGSATAAFAWVAPDVVDPVSLYTVIDPDHTLDDANRVNNTMSETVVMPDLVATTSRWEQAGPTTMIVYVRVSNQGALEAGAHTAELRLNGSAGDLPLSDTVGPLAPPASEDIGVSVDISTFGDSALTIFATLDSSNAIAEFDEDNNTLMVTLQPDNFDKDGVPNHIDLDDDGDGLSDADEETLGTNPLNADTDGDGHLHCPVSGVEPDRNLRGPGRTARETAHSRDRTPRIQFRGAWEGHSSARSWSAKATATDSPDACQSQAYQAQSNGFRNFIPYWRALLCEGTVNGRS